MSTTRRRFLETSGGLALGLGLLGASCVEEPDPVAPTPGTARPWGTAPDAAGTQALLPAERRPERILEFYMSGGLNPWDTFYVVPEHGDPSGGGVASQWWTFQQGPDNVAQHFMACGGGSRPLYEPYGVDAAGRTVNLGPWLLALRDRPDVLARMRVFVMRHEQKAHEAAHPLALTGVRLASPRGAGTGAHIERYFQTASPGARAVPNSAVLIPRHRFDTLDSTVAATGIGYHPGGARPLTLRVGKPPSGFGTSLEGSFERLGVAGHRDDLDALVELYRGRYEAPYRVDGARVRSRVLADFEDARRRITNVDQLASLLPPGTLDAALGEVCGDGSDDDVTTPVLDAALRLLLADGEASRYAICIDGGFREALGGEGYDTHVNHVRDASRNVTHGIRRLMESINQPGEGDPGKIDLDRHQVLITTEFGRGPVPQAGPGMGLDHWPYGYVTIAIGGFVDEERAGIVGAIDGDGNATTYTTPAEFRAALLVAMGIWPFSEESFRVSDVRGARTELEGVLALRELVLGYSA